MIDPGCGCAPGTQAALWQILRPLDAFGQIMWVPEGFAHGFLVVSETADFLYKTTDYYAPAEERCIRWDDKTLNISWPPTGAVLQLSSKDQAGAAFDAAQLIG